MKSLVGQVFVFCGLASRDTFRHILLYFYLNIFTYVHDVGDFVCLTGERLVMQEILYVH